MNTSVTVNILNFNRINKLSYCLPSLIGTAGYDNWELSVTDNGSNDGCVAYLKDAYKKYDVFKRLILLPKNYGEGRGARIGMEYAKGDILVHSCNDLKYVRNGWLTETVEVLNNTKDVICYAPAVTKNYGGEIIKMESGHEIKIKVGGIPAFCVAIKCKDYEEIGGFKDCGSAMGPKMLRHKVWAMETLFAHEVRQLAEKRKYEINGCALPKLEDSAALHDWNERGYRDTVHDWSKDTSDRKRIQVMEKQ